MCPELDLDYILNSGIRPDIGGGAGIYPLTPDKCKSKLLFANDMVHREDLFALEEGDRETVVTVSSDGEEKGRKLVWLLLI